MKIGNLDDYTRGWLVGFFEPAIIKSNDIEIAVQHYDAGHEEPAHVHKVADEYNVIIKGKVKFDEFYYNEGDICLIPKGEDTKFKAIIDSTVLVIKTPSVPNDKYLIDD